MPTHGHSLGQGDARVSARLATGLLSDTLQGDLLRRRSVFRAGTRKVGEFVEEMNGAEVLGEEYLSFAEYSNRRVDKGCAIRLAQAV